MSHLTKSSRVGYSDHAGVRAIQYTLAVIEAQGLTPDVAQTRIAQLTDVIARQGRVTTDVFNEIEGLLRAAEYAGHVAFVEANLDLLASLRTRLAQSQRFVLN